MHDAEGKKKYPPAGPTRYQNPRWFPNHTTVLVLNLRRQKSLSKDLCKDAAIFWKILSAKSYIPLSKCACQGMTLLPPYVRNSVGRFIDDMSLRPLGPDRPTLALSNPFYTS